MPPQTVARTPGRRVPPDVCFAARIEDMRREIGVAQHTNGTTNGVDELQLIELIDEGTYGKVFKGLPDTTTTADVGCVMASNRLQCKVLLAVSALVPDHITTRQQYRPVVVCTLLRTCRNTAPCVTLATVSCVCHKHNTVQACGAAARLRSRPWSFPPK
jgi:hypothetical protein